MPLIPKVKSKAKVKAKPISNPNPKPKYGEYECPHCQAHTEGKFLLTDSIYCYMCSRQMLVKDMVKVEKPKEYKPLVKLDPYFKDPLSYTFHFEWTEKYGYYTIIDGHGKIRKDLMR